MLPIVGRILFNAGMADPAPPPIPSTLERVFPLAKRGALLAGCFTGPIIIGTAVAVLAINFSFGGKRGLAAEWLPGLPFVLPFIGLCFARTRTYSIGTLLMGLAVALYFVGIWVADAIRR